MTEFKLMMYLSPSDCYKVEDVVDMLNRLNSIFNVDRVSGAFYVDIAVPKSEVKPVSFLSGERVEIEETKVGVEAKAEEAEEVEEEIESREDKEEDKEEDRIPEDKLKEGWINLSRKTYYKVEEDRVRFAWLNKGRLNSLGSYSFETLDKVFEKLPEEASSVDVARVLDEVGVSISNPNRITMLMKFFATYVRYDAKLVQKPGTRRMFIVKDIDFSLREEARRKMDLENQIID